MTIEQLKLDNKIQLYSCLNKPYSKGLYNKFDDNEQWIRITEGCPNKCSFCNESIENGVLPVYYQIPNIVRNKVKIMDMNLLYKPKCVEIIKELGNKRINNKVVYYELICGIDYRFMTKDKAQLLKDNRFINIRLAWDHSFSEQKRIKKCIDDLISVGYNPKDIMVFMICNYSITYENNLRKLDLCKIWNVQVADCWFDNQTMPNVKPIYWSIEQIKDFRKKTRKHNQMINFRIDPEFKV